MIMENTPCIAKRKEAITLRLKVKVLLDTLKNNISIISDNKHVLGNPVRKCEENSKHNGTRGASALAKIKWILEGTTKEFYTVYNEPSNVYYKLIESYDILGKGNKEEKEEEKDKYEIKDNKLSLDDLYVLETEVEICKNILKYIYHSEIMKTLEHNCYNEGQTEDGSNSYILALLYDVIDCIRLKKINNSRIIYQMNS
jgi:hypothetical protein